MQRFWLLLVAGAFSLSACWAGASEPGSARQYASFEKMAPQARAAWVEEMLRRLDEANRVVLDPAAVAKQHSRFEETLAAFVDNQADWQSSIETFGTELALSQRAAIEHLTRRYRIAAYRVVRTDRPAFDERRQSLERLMTLWRNSDSPRDEQYKVVRWLAAAIPASDDADLGPVPALPEFVEAGRMVAASPVMPAVEEMPAIDPTTSGGSPKATDSPPELRPARFLADRIAASVDFDAVRPATFHTPVTVGLKPNVPLAATAPHPIAMRPSFEPSGFAAVLKPAMAPASRDTWRQPSSVAGVTRPFSTSQPYVASRSAPPSPNRSGDPFAFARTKVDRLTMVSTIGQPDSTSRPGSSGFTRPGSGHSTPATMAQAGREYEGYSSGSYSSGRTVPSSADNDSPPTLDPQTAEPGDFAAQEAATGRDGGSRPAGTPNLDELTARIRGNNMALRKLAARLYEENQTWDAESLTAVFDQLAPLVARKDDLKLIRELVPAPQRQRVGDLESGSDLIADLGSKIAQARNQVKQGQFQGSIGQRKTELDRLDQLSRKLAGLVFAD